MRALRLAGNGALRLVVRRLAFVGDHFGQLSVDAGAAQVGDVQQVDARVDVAGCAHRSVVVISYKQTT